VIIYISKIFNWFGKDFGKNKEERIAFMLTYLDQSTAEKIKKAKSVKIKYLPYDWNLNARFVASGGQGGSFRENRPV
jgi:hypothetical protein